MKILFTFFAKQATLMKRSTVLNLPLQLVFPGSCLAIVLLTQQMLRTQSYADVRILYASKKLIKKVPLGIHFLIWKWNRWIIKNRKFRRICLENRVTRWLGRKCPIYFKSSQNSDRAKNAKISSSEKSLNQTFKPLEISTANHLAIM
jgi:hypothetical protein